MCVRQREKDVCVCVCERERERGKWKGDRETGARLDCGGPGAVSLRHFGLDPVGNKVSSQTFEWRYSVHTVRRITCPTLKSTCR